MDITSGNILMCRFLPVNFYFPRYLTTAKHHNSYFNMNVIFSEAAIFSYFIFMICNIKTIHVYTSFDDKKSNVKLTKYN